MRRRLFWSRKSGTIVSVRGPNSSPSSHPSTFALLMYILINGLADCSTESKIKEKGEDPSRRERSFCIKRRLCTRRCCKILSAIGIYVEKRQFSDNVTEKVTLQEHVKRS